MWVSLYILIILSSILWLPESLNGNIRFNDPFWIPKEFIFVVFSSLIICFSFIYNDVKVRTFRNKWIALIFIFSILIFAVEFFYPLIFNNDKGAVAWNLKIIRPNINFILGVFLTVTLIENTSDFSEWVRILKLMIYIGSLFAVYGILQYFGIDQIFGGNKFLVDGREIKMVTFLGNKMLTGHYIAMISPLCLMFKNMWYRIAFIVMGVAILLTGSVVALISYFVGLYVYLLMNKRFLYMIIISVLSILALFLMNKFYSGFLYDGNRFWLWLETIKNNSRPFFGNVIGSYGMVFKQGLNSQVNVIHAHNEFVQLYWEGGLLLLIFIIGYICSLFKRIILEFFEDNSILLIGTTAGLCAWIIISLAGFPLRIAPMAVVFIIYISCLEAQLTRRII